MPEVDVKILKYSLNHLATLLENLPPGLERETCLTLHDRLAKTVSKSLETNGNGHVVDPGQPLGELVGYTLGSNGKQYPIYKTHEPPEKAAVTKPVNPSPDPTKTIRSHVNQGSDGMTLSPELTPNEFVAAQERVALDRMESMKKKAEGMKAPPFRYVNPNDECPSCCSLMSEHPWMNNIVDLDGRIYLKLGCGPSNKTGFDLICDGSLKQ